MNEVATPSPAFINELRRRPPTQRLSYVREAGAPGEVLLALADTTARLAAAEVGEAIELGQIALAIADEFGETLPRVRNRRSYARALAYAGRFEASLATCLEAIDLATDAGLAVEAGRARLASMHALGELGRLDDAINAGHAARTAFEQAGEPALAARAEINLGVIYQKRDDPEAALTRFARAREALAAEPEMLGHVDNNRGEALLAVNDFAGAEAAFLAALHVFESAGAAVTAAIVEGNLADLAAREGRLDRALYFFEGARRHLDAEDAPAVAARLLAEQADAKMILGMPAAALREYEDALVELDRLGLALEAARARCGLGLALMRLDRPADAATALAAAAVAFEELGHVSARARVDLARAELSLVHDRPAEARRLATRALAVLDGRDADRAAARHIMARASFAAGDLETAWADLTAALAAARELDLAPLLADIHETRGRVARAAGRLDTALVELVEAVDHIERLRGALQADRFRTAFLGQRHSAYDVLVDAWLDNGTPAATREAFAVAERAKGRSLLEQIGRGADLEPGDAPNRLDPGERTLLETRTRLRSEVNALYSRLADERIPSGLDGTRSWREALRDREAELDAVESRLAAMQPAAGLFQPTVGIDEVQACLSDDERVVEYFIAGGHLLAFVIGPDEVSVERKLTGMRPIHDRLARLQFQIDRALRPGASEGIRAARRIVDAKRELAGLYDLLLRPLRTILGDARRLIIIPHAATHQVPWNALWDGAEWLIDRYDIRLCPSASVLVLLRNSAAHAPDHAGPVVVGVADAVAPAIDREARIVASTLDTASLMIGGDATVAAVMSAAEDASILHLACHGRFLRDHPHGSGLRLADRWLTLRDIGDLRLPATHVTLSGCETGLSRLETGDEMVGLLRSLLAAGARSILVSSWRVGDAETLDLMTDLYSCTAVQTPGSRLRDAQTALRQRHPHPAHWAAFHLVGEP